MESFMKEFEHLKIQLEEIKKATNNFRNEVIGSGGFGKVYEGVVSHSKGRSMVAIKRLDRKFGQGDPEFLKEIMMLSRYSHENLISLLGFCDEVDEKILVYEHASNGSLDRHLSSTDLTWTQRIKICLDAARGLSFLHDDNGTHQRVFHRDIKSGNILVDDNWNAKVSDMGLSKIGPANQPHTFIFTNVVGTPGYCDPQYMKTYTLTKESDVYSFGVVLFEVLCGRLCFEYSNGQLEILVPTWKQSYKDKKLDEIILQDLMQPMDPTCLETFSDIAFECLHKSREQRPQMSVVVEKLDIALQFQEPLDLKLPKEYEEILKAALPPLIYRSKKELKMLLSKGVFLDRGKTWFSLNDNGEHCEMISIADCLILDSHLDYRRRFSSYYHSRFESGCYQTYGNRFKVHVRPQFLSPLVTYTVNLVFKCTHKENFRKKQYIAIKYELEGEIKISIVYLADKREDKRLIARLYQFTNDRTTVNLEINFQNTCCNLEIEGIEFQPVENVEHQVIEYQEILKASVPPLFYRSVEELKVLLSKGVLLNWGKTWFSLNENGGHCEMISIAECLIPNDDEDYSSRYLSNYNSRFVAGCYVPSNHKKFKTRVRTQFLSPQITYTVNFVFKCSYRVKTKQLIREGIKYRLEGETKTSIVYLADEREDEWLMAELYQFTSDGTTVDLEIMFDYDDNYIVVEGIEFQPLEKAEHQLSEDEKVDLPTTSDSDTYWKQKLPNDYQDIIKLSKDSVQWRTKKELYSILCTGVLINNGQEWFFLDKNGRKCLMLSARAVWEVLDQMYPIYQSFLESRFGEALALYYDDQLCLVSEIKSQVLSPQTTYGTYLVYQLPEDPSEFEDPLVVRYKDSGSDEWKTGEFWCIYLVSPQTPVIRPNGNQNAYNPVNRPKIKGIPHQRSDGWMEVQVWEFQTDTTTKMIHMGLRLKNFRNMFLYGLIIQGIEFRPI